MAKGNPNPDGHARFNSDTPTAFQNLSEERMKEVSAIGGRKSGESKRFFYDFHFFRGAFHLPEHFQAFTD